MRIACEWAARGLTRHPPPELMHRCLANHNRASIAKTPNNEGISAGDHTSCPATTGHTANVKSILHNNGNPYQRT